MYIFADAFVYQSADCFLQTAVLQGCYTRLNALLWSGIYQLDLCWKLWFLFNVMFKYFVE